MTLPLVILFIRDGQFTDGLCFECAVKSVDNPHGSRIELQIQQASGVYCADCHVEIKGIEL